MGIGRDGSPNEWKSRGGEWKSREDAMSYLLFERARFAAPVWDGWDGMGWGKEGDRDACMEGRGGCIGGIYENYRML